VHLADGRPDAIEPDVPDHRVLLDAHDPVRHGGTGQTIDWARARLLAQARQVILAGGLTPDNVRQAIDEVRPFAVDVSSGVELRPGVKDHALLRAFIAAAKGTGT
jgi:phosphoribosylanthranilate isomerase